MTAVSGVIVDVRALQAHDHAVRGIGRYTFELIEAVERLAPGLVSAFVTDPTFPTHERVQRLMGTGKLVRADDPRFDRDPPRVFHITSPFVEGHGPVRMLPRWAEGPDTRVVATVYDLIPARFPHVDLAEPTAAGWYRNRCEFLRTCDRLYSISETTTADLVDLIGIDPAMVRTIHGAASSRFVPPDVPRAEILSRLEPVLPDSFKSSTPPEGYVLCPTGIEWRKNLDRFFQGWALIEPGIRRRFPLIVQCHLSDESRSSVEARLRELGIRGDVELTGAVEDATLVKLLQAATLVVYPSTFEGLGLPVLEARRCGVPVLCGDNSSLREIIENPEARFDAEDVVAMTDSVRRVLLDDELRARLAQDPVGQRYTWDEVAHRVIADYEELAAAPSRITVRQQPRLALASPVPPQMCGPAGYFGHLVEHVAPLCALTVFTTIDPAEAQLPDGVRAERLTQLGFIEASEGAFDEVVYFVGNSAFHVEETAALMHRPGAVLLHDARLTILYTDLAAAHPELLPETFGGALHRMYPGRYPAPMGWAQYLPLPEEALFGVLMVADVARVATRLFVHSHHAADLIELDCGRRPEVAFAIPSPELGAWEPRHDSPPLVASFGFVSPIKRSAEILVAMSEVPEASVALVGNSGPEYLAALARLAVELEMAERVTITGAVDDEEYRSWLARPSLALQLRSHSNGESSASVAETLAAGIPTIVSDVGSFGDYPDDVVVKVSTELDPVGLGRVIAELLADGERLAELGEHGRRYAAANTYRIAAARLVDTLFADRT